MMSMSMRHTLVHIPLVCPEVSCGRKADELHTWMAPRRGIFCYHFFGGMAARARGGFFLRREEERIPIAFNMDENNMTFTTASFFLVPVILTWQVVFLHGGQLEVVNLAVSFPPFGVARADMAVHVTLLWRPSLGTDEPGLGSGEEKGGGIYIPTYDGDKDGVGGIQLFRGGVSGRRRRMKRATNAQNEYANMVGRDRFDGGSQEREGRKLESWA